MAVDDLRSGTWVTYVGGRATSARLRRCRVEVVTGADAGLVRDIETSVIRIGARRGNDVQLTDSKVSGLHCEIRLDDRGYRLRDLDSTNGTFVGELRVREVWLKPGQEFRVGHTLLRFVPMQDIVEIPLSKRDTFESVTGSSVKMREIFATLEKVAPSELTVLVTGETGTGKELVAHAIHAASKRATRAFVRVNCAAIPQGLIASELFGHEKGAFTGALQRRIGRFESADGGTLFLDEVCELPAETQIALLRVLQEREFERVGSNHPIQVDVRVLTATNRNLRAAVADGKFREDLFYRLNVFPIAVPSLRERTDDIPLLVEYLLERSAKKAGKKIKRIEKTTLDLFKAYGWPGNVRELQNVVERAVILCEGDTLSVDPSWFAAGLHGASETIGAAMGERERIEVALRESKGRVGGPFGAANKLGVPRQTLDSRIAALAIDKYQFRR